ncbi:MAG: PRC-barrel domain-containing protein [Patescibacteria group bacterium]
MFIEAKKIIGNKVVTQSGQSLGRVVDFEIDTSNQSISKYYVHSFLKESLIINVSQVIEIKKDKIIVEDTLISAPDVEYAK